MDVFKTYGFCSGFPMPKVPNTERELAEPSVPGTRNRGRTKFFSLSFGSCSLLLSFCFRYIFISF